MSTETVTKCDFCSKVKGETNHWYRVRIIDKTFVVLPWELVASCLYRGSPFPEAHLQKDACGFQCCTQALARFLDHDDFSEHGTRAIAVERETAKETVPDAQPQDSL